MRLLTTLCLVCLISLSLSSCATSSDTHTFSTKNIMMVHVGMSSNEILTIFGGPRNISASVCGMFPNQWTCTTWEYGYFPYNATFTFSGKHDSLKLNNFQVNRGGF